MNTITFEYKESCGVSLQEIEQVGERLIPEINRIQAVRGAGYDSDYASINLLSDQEMFARVQALIDQKKQLNPTAIIVIGIGGSSLGTAAVHQALYGFSPGERTSLPIYYADTIDSDYTSALVTLVERELSHGGNRSEEHTSELQSLRHLVCRL